MMVDMVVGLSQIGPEPGLSQSQSDNTKVFLVRIEDGCYF